MDICNVLQITPEQLLTGKGIEDEENINVTSRESCNINVFFILDTFSSKKKTLMLQVVRVVLRLMIFNWFKIIMDLRKNSRSV